MLVPVWGLMTLVYIDDGIHDSALVYDESLFWRTLGGTRYSVLTTEEAHERRTQVKSAADAPRVPVTFTYLVKNAVSVR